MSEERETKQAALYQLRSEYDGVMLIYKEVFRKEFQACQSCPLTDCHLPGNYHDPKSCFIFRVVKELQEMETRWRNDEAINPTIKEGGLVI